MSLNQLLCLVPRGARSFDIFKLTTSVDSASSHIRAIYIRRVLHKTRTFRINGTFRLK